ncbi:MAG: DUF1778 domain-containing protein [Xanthobacteraceae bacterium]|nr:DUF1778 domain-containing protein [Xanthobacteraceae bacterium]
MPTAPTRRQRRETLNLRIRPEERGLIDQAARAVGKNRTDFVLEAARKAAEAALLDQVLFTVDATTFSKFQAMLDAPAQSNNLLRKTLRTPGPWERA